MLRTIEFIFIFFIGISLIVAASLFNGIEIDNIIYKNIIIKKLYLKYDKKLNISSPEISIKNQNSEEPIRMSAKLTLDYNNGLFEVDVQEFSLYDTDIHATGLIYIDQDKIDLDNKSEVMVENLILTFDDKMEKIQAQETYVNYHNNAINITFKKPFYGDVAIDKSKVSYLIDEDILKLYLKTKSLFNETLRNAFSRYDVDIKTIQYDGKNDISTNIFIPFGKGDVFIESDIIIKDSNIEEYGQKYKVNKSTLNYKNKIIKGTIDLNKLTYDDINVTNSILKYKIDLTNGFKLNANAKKINVTKENNDVYFENALFEVKNNQITFSSNIKDKENKIDIDFKNKTNLNTKELTGNFNLKYDDTDNNISIVTDNISYNGDFKNEFTVDIYSKDINITKPQENSIKNLSLNIKDNQLKSNFLLENKQQTQSFEVFNTTNLDEKLSYGNINIKNLKYKNLVNLQNKNIPFNISFRDNIVVNSSLFGLTYFKELGTKKHKLIVSNPNKLLEGFTFINPNQNDKGFIDIESDDLNNTIVYINNLNFDINSTYFDSADNNKTENFVLPKFPLLNLVYNNSEIKYDNLTLTFDQLRLKTDQNILNLHIKNKNAILDLKTKDNSVIFNATNLSDDYVNHFLNRELLEDGSMDINIYGDDINELSGDINFYDTTVKNVTIINSLLTFVNTTPAIFNPLLALPTLFRLAETGFDTNGYYLKNGQGSFRFNLPNQELNVYDLYTNGKMSNFIFNSNIKLKTKKIDANVDISFLKDFTQAIRYIPVIGYIIMGDDGEFHTSVDITGTTDNPVLETNTITEATSGVTGILERIITLPLLPFMSNDKEQ